MPASSATADRILDAAGRCFAARGVRRTTIEEVALEAACSRPTVYRWFADRDALRFAFVEREARRVGDRVAAAAATGGAVDAVLTALELVRGDPTLAAWFAEGDAGLAEQAAAMSAAIDALTGGTDAGRWLVRVILSFLALPGASAEEERALIERFVLPVVA